MTDAEYQAKYGWFDDDAHNGIKSKERVHKFAEVLTPRWLAEKMIDMIPGASEIEVSEKSQRFQRKFRETNKGRKAAAFILCFMLSDSLPGTTIASCSYRIAGSGIEPEFGG